MPRTTKTKAIAATVASQGTTQNPQNQSAASDGPAVASTLMRALTVREAYELSIHVRKAVDSIAHQISKAKPLVYSRTTDSVIQSSPLIDLMRNPGPFSNFSRYVLQTVSDMVLFGEFDVWAFPGTGTPQQLLRLDPERLHTNPTFVRSYNMLNGWSYRDYAGQAGSIGAMIDINKEDILHGTNYNPSNEVRGLSPILAGEMEVSANYFIGRYNTSFFQNGAHSDIIVRFPKGTNRKVAEEWVEEWQKKHAIYQNGGFKISAIIGDDMQIETPNQSARDGQFQQLAQMNAESIGGLFGVPPSIMGFLSKTRFDTIDIEQEIFAENTLMPIMELWTAVHQTQLVDRYFPKSSGTSKALTKGVGQFRRATREALTKAMDERPQSDVVFILDPDSLPIMAKLLLSKVRAAKEVADGLFVSRSEAARYVGLDIESNPIRDSIYIPNGYSLATDPASAKPDNQQNPPKDAQTELDDALDSDEPEDDDQTKGLSSAVGVVRNLFHDLRKPILEAKSAGSRYPKAAALEAVKQSGLTLLHQSALTLHVHREFLAFASQKDVASVKARLNEQTKTRFIKQILKGP